MARGQVPRRDSGAQADDATTFWANLLIMYPASCPATFTLMEIGKAVGTMMTMCLQDASGARPVQVYPP